MTIVVCVAELRAELIIATTVAGTGIVVTTLGPLGATELPLLGVLLPLLGVLLPLLGVLLPLLGVLLPLLGVLLLVVVVTPLTLMEVVDMLASPQLGHSTVKAPAVTRSNWALLRRLAAAAT